jgi:uncharacterized protein
MMPFSPKPRMNLMPSLAALPKAHKIMLGDVELRPDLSGALHVPEFKALIIADLHLEQGSSLARRGIRVPPYDTAITLGLLESVVARLAPQRLLFLGDSFHDVESEARLAEDALARLQKISQAHECFWISGNHDPKPPEFLHGHTADRVMLGPLMLRHEPLGLRENEFEISGHLHPGCAITQRGRRISGKCFVADQRRLIMPAFGAYTGALSIFSDAFAGLFSREEAQVWMMGNRDLHRFPVSRLG